MTDEHSAPPRRGLDRFPLWFIVVIGVGAVASNFPPLASTSTFHSVTGTLAAIGFTLMITSRLLLSRRGAQTPRGKARRA